MLGFFEGHRRSLPWRETRDPYAILVSEIMLQQTRVDTALPYYLRWMEQFPDLARLAAASEDEVLRAWQGLGYYRRARNLQKLAREQVASGGPLPDTPEALMALPGIGAYTAGAVASIAFGRPVPAVDGNVRRVLARVLDDPSPSPARLQQVAGALVDLGAPGDFNQAMMELGALVCTPRDPRCSACPVAAQCASHAAGTQALRPAPPKPKVVPQVHEVALMLLWSSCGKRTTHVLLHRRPEGGLLAGMWSLPLEALGSEGVSGADVLAAGQGLAVSLLGGHPADGELEAPVRHIFTHRKVTYHPVRFVLPPGDEPPAPPPEMQWVDLSALDAYPLPRAQQRMLGGAQPMGSS